MPGFDGTGPRGLGPMTGCGEGYCVISLDHTARTSYGYAGLQGRPVPLFRRRWICPVRRAGRTPWWSAPTGLPAKGQGVEVLKAQTGWLRQQLDAINERIEELDRESE